ncbi:copper amine oxidase N-terminal domain-containing protein [Pelotomaculum propionicicum]|uniref:Copper amine oxidase-like N-terminal domain-containing protein n=1 Tax=Pelotomaculum propionicicum TaxID=258475 RepID=A0A4Y7RN48_9FIRM|nr:copper amine oxidase N-terminal domain-containing protein [Pelotomaculum propionicicum]TEB09717.1 hypothetical protein Pmgp_02894 [Pelotomaculum propionicicum]
MKRFSLYAILLVIVTCLCLRPGLTSEVLGKIIFFAGKSEYNIDGQVYTMRMMPVILEGNFYVPVRDLAEAVGADVIWDGSGKSATVTREYNARRFVAVIKVGSDEITLTNTPGKGISAQFITVKKIQMIPTPLIINGRLMAPVRPLAEALGNKVSWDAGSGTVTIYPGGEYRER